MTKRRKRVRIKSHWVVPQETLVVRLAASSFSLLVEKSDENEMPLSTYVRYLLERGIGMSQPGMLNKDGLYWQMKHPKDPY